MPSLKAWVDRMLAAIPSVCGDGADTGDGPFSMYEKASADRPWAAKPDYMKISTGGEAEQRCAAAAYGAGAGAFSVVKKGNGEARCAVFASAPALCSAGQTNPRICRLESTGAYKLKA